MNQDDALEYNRVCCRLDEAEAEISRMDTDHADLRRENAALKQVLKDLHGALLNEEDIIDGPHPGDPPRPNWAMQADMLLGRIMERHEVEL